MDQKENIPKEEKNIQKERNHSQILSQNLNYPIKPPTPESNQSNKQYYTQRENISNIMSKIIKDNLNNNNCNHNMPSYYLPQNQNKYYIKNSFSTQNNYNEISNNSNPLLKHQLKQLKLNYIALNNDNIIYREDINKLI